MLLTSAEFGIDFDPIDVPLDLQKEGSKEIFVPC